MHTCQMRFVCGNCEAYYLNENAPGAVCEIQCYHVFGKLSKSILSIISERRWHQASTSCVGLMFCLVPIRGFVKDRIGFLLCDVSFKDTREGRKDRYIWQNLLWTSIQPLKWRCKWRTTQEYILRRGWCFGCFVLLLSLLLGTFYEIQLNTTASSTTRTLKESWFLEAKVCQLSDRVTR